MSERSNGPRTAVSFLSGTDGAVSTDSTPQPLETSQPRDSDPAQGVFSQAEHLAATVKDKANAAVVGVGETLTGMAQRLRTQSPPTFAPYAEKAAVGLEQAGAYLQRETGGGVFADLSSIVRRHPVPAVLAGVVVGFIFARKLRR